MPCPSLAIRRLLADLLRRRGDCSDDVGIAGAPADIAGEAVADLALRSGPAAADQIHRGDQHRRRAEAALKCMVSMEVSTHRRHYRVAGKPFDGLDRAVVAGDGEH